MMKLEAQPRLEDKQLEIGPIRDIVQKIETIRGEGAQELKAIAQSVKNYLKSIERQTRPVLHVVYVEYTPSALDTVRRNLAEGSAPTALKDAWAVLQKEERDFVPTSDRWSTADPKISSIRRCLDAIWATELGGFKLAT